MEVEVIHIVEDMMDSEDFEHLEEVYYIQMVEDIELLVVENILVEVLDNLHFVYSDDVDADDIDVVVAMDQKEDLLLQQLQDHDVIVMVEDVDENLLDIHLMVELYQDLDDETDHDDGYEMDQDLVEGMFAVVDHAHNEYYDDHGSVHVHRDLVHHSERKQKWKGKKRR